MYQAAKKIISVIVGKERLLRHEESLRHLYSAFFSGSSHQCSICNKKLSRFSKLPNGDLLCPKCGSLSRDRRLWKLLNEEYLKPGQKVLDFSPSRALARKMKTIDNIIYLSTDLSGNFIADYRFDITALNLPDNDIDLILCYHILEHIADDRKAMAELYRVLKPGGKTLVQTPFKEGEIYEDFSITNPKQREIHFGQDDHVRYYSVNGLKTRLEEAGFSVRVNVFSNDIFYGLREETVLALTKN